MAVNQITSTDMIPQKSDYLRLRSRYTPVDCRTIFVLESPPRSGMYFYNPDGSTSEPLFKAIMKDVLGMEPRTKAEGLEEFCRFGYMVIDATYTPVNGLNDKEAETIIERDFPLLLEDLNSHAGPQTQLVLIKANICRKLEPKLAMSFDVLNRGTVIPFPSSGQQTKFKVAIQRVLGRSGSSQ